MKIAVIGGGSTYTPELIEGFARRADTLTVDELVLHVVPVLLVRGERLVDGVADPGFTQVEVVPTPYATHLRYRVNH